LADATTRTTAAEKRLRIEGLKASPVVPYDRAMRRECLRIFDLNIPRFFDGRERVLFEEYLDSLPGTYFAIVFEGQVAACGGYFILPEEKIAGLSWGIVRPDCQHMGVGKRLLLTRLLAILGLHEIDRVILDTSQNASGFFRHFGFAETRTTQDGYAPGLDRVEMTLPVDARFRSDLIRRCRRLGFSPPAEPEPLPSARRPGR
jgi:GNAT superfamily N-acetyltransferase